MLERLYTETVGMDGHGGMKADIQEIKIEGVEGRRKIHVKVDVIEKTMVTQTECTAIRKNAGDRKDKILMRIKDIALLAAAIAGFLWGSGILSRGR